MLSGSLSDRTNSAAMRAVLACGGYKSKDCDAAPYLRLVAELNAALAREETLLREKDELILRQELLSQESDHRLLNSLQMVSSILFMQARGAASGEAASQLTSAAARVAALGRIHQRLHSMDSASDIPFRPYLEGICGDISAMLCSQGLAAAVSLKAIDLTLRTAAATPLGFVVNELITNAAKYGTGQIAVELTRRDDRICVLSVSNDGPPLPAEFLPKNSDGLGMKIIQAFLLQIGGDLEFGFADARQGARFTVCFPAAG